MLELEQRQQQFDMWLEIERKNRAAQSDRLFGFCNKWMIAIAGIGVILATIQIIPIVRNWNKREAPPVPPVTNIFNQLSIPPSSTIEPNGPSPNPSTYP